MSRVNAPLDDDELEVWRRLLEQLKAAGEAGERAERPPSAERKEELRVRGWLERLRVVLRSVRRRTAPPSSPDSSSITAILISADNLERQISVQCPPPRVWHNALPPPLGAAFISDGAIPPSSPPMPETRDYELRKFDPQLGAAIYTEVRR